MALTLVRELRKKQKLSQEAVAESVGISTSQLSRFENGERDPSLPDLQRLAAYFRLSVGGLIGETTSRQIPIISWVSAGKLAEPEIETPSHDAKTIGFSDLPNGDYFALRVQGDSMDRISPEGSIIVVDRADRTLTTGKPYVFSLRGETTYKLWRPRPARLEPYSTNPSNQTIFPQRDHDYAVVGRVRRTVLDL